MSSSQRRQRSKVMPHCNRSLPFQLVEIHDNDGSKQYGILDAYKSVNNKYFIWRSRNLISEEIDFEKDLTVLNMKVSTLLILLHPFCN